MAGSVLAYIGQRAAYLAVTVILVATLVFVVLRVLPGDPARTIAGMEGDEQAVERIRRRLGTDRPIVEQYARWLWDLARLDLGTSFRTGEPVAELLSARVAVTFGIAFGALAVALVIALPLGTAAALLPGRWIGRAIDWYARITLAVPSFWLGMLLLLVFAVWLRVLPMFGATGPAHFVLPIMAPAIERTGLLIRVIRASVTDENAKEYVQAAFARGVPRRTTIARHVLKNALIPVVTIAAIQLGYLLGGTVIMEHVFSLPGLGRALISAILARDYPVIQAGVVLTAAAFSLVNFFADVVYTVADPRLRT